LISGIGHKILYTTASAGANNSERGNFDLMGRHFGRIAIGIRRTVTSHGKWAGGNNEHLITSIYRAA